MKLIVISIGVIVLVLGVAIWINWPEPLVHTGYDGRVLTEYQMARCQSLREEHHAIVGEMGLNIGILPNFELDPEYEFPTTRDEMDSQHEISEELSRHAERVWTELVELCGDPAPNAERVP